MDLTQATLLAGILALAVLVIYYQLKARADHPARVHGGISKEDRRFLRMAATVSATEVSLSQLALKLSSAAPVQYMAKRIVDDQTQVNRKLASLAWRYRVHVSAEPGPEAQQKARQLRMLRGSAFDHAYDEVVVQDHRKAIDLFASAAHSANAEIRWLAESTLPTLDLHLKMAQDLDPRVAAVPAPPWPPM
jgi:putative membrane protein